MTRSKSVNKDNGEKIEVISKDISQSTLVKSEDRLVRNFRFLRSFKISFSLSEANTAKIGSLLDLSLDSADSKTIQKSSDTVLNIIKLSII